MANTDIDPVDESAPLSEAEFVERVDLLYDNIGDACEDEPHFGVTLFALLSTTAAELSDMVAATPGMLPETALMEAQKQLEELFKEYRQEVSASDKRRLN